MPDLDDDLVTLSNEALARIGEEAIGLDDESALAGLVQLTAPRIVDAALCRQAFAFNTFTFALVRDDTATYRAGYVYAFRQTGGRLRGPLRVALADDPDTLVRGYRLENDYLFADAEAVVASYIMRPPISQWPALFREFCILQLAQAFCLAQTAKLDFSQDFERKAVGMPSERGRGGAWGAFVTSELANGSGPKSFGFGDWLTGARGTAARLQG